MNHTLCQLSYFAFHTQAQINPPGCSSTPIGEPWFLPQSVALPLVSLTPSLNICILYNVLRWIWTIDLLIFNQSHLPLSYQDFLYNFKASLPCQGLSSRSKFKFWYLRLGTLWWGRILSPLTVIMTKSAGVEPANGSIKTSCLNLLATTYV